MTPLRPHLFNAFYNWLLENQLTPLIVVRANTPNCRVPMQHVKDGQIVLNLAPHAIGQYQQQDWGISFHARFGGVSQQLVVPYAAIDAIYARENGAGTMFEADAAYEDSAEENTAPEAATELETATSEPTPPKGGRPSLRVVK